MAKKILVIDDEELIIKSLSRLLEKNGYEVFVFILLVQIGKIALKSL